jgi:hypothetical protein
LVLKPMTAATVAGRVCSGIVFPDGKRGRAAHRADDRTRRWKGKAGQHLGIGLKALEKLKAQEWERLHSRKLRSFAEVAFQ